MIQSLHLPASLSIRLTFFLTIIRLQFFNSFFSEVLRKMLAWLKSTKLYLGNQKSSTMIVLKLLFFNHVWLTNHRIIMAVKAIRTMRNPWYRYRMFAILWFWTNSPRKRYPIKEDCSRGGNIHWITKDTSRCVADSCFRCCVGITSTRLWIFSPRNNFAFSDLCQICQPLDLRFHPIPDQVSNPSEIQWWCFVYRVKRFCDWWLLRIVFRDSNRSWSGASREPSAKNETKKPGVSNWITKQRGHHRSCWRSIL